jgi:hypothetical protein
MWSIVVAGLASLPLIVYFVYATWLEPISPFYANYDPEFQYMLNSLEVFKGRPYYYADHPGSPLEVLGTALYTLTLPFLRMDINAFIRFHLVHPRIFLTVAHGFLVLASAVTLSILTGVGLSNRRSAPGMFGIALGLMYFAVHPMAFESLMLWSHNSFSFAFGTLLSALLYRLLYSIPSGKAIPWQPLAWLSIGAGLLASITIYLAAWAVGYAVIVVIWCVLSAAPRSKAWGSVLVVALGSLAGFTLGVLPVLHRLSEFADWIAALLTHESTYLLTAPDQPLLAQWTDNLTGLVRQLPVLFSVGLGLSAMAGLALVRWRRSLQEQPASWSVALGLMFQCLLLTVFILDHPKPDYMLAVAATQPVLVWSILELHGRAPLVSRVLRNVFVTLVLTGVVAALIASAARHADKARSIARVERQVNLLQDEYAASQRRHPQSLVMVWTYGTYSPCFSWWFGNDSTDNAFRREIGKLCPRQLALDIFGQMVIPRQGARPLEQTGWDMIVGCRDAFTIPALKDLPHVESFPELDLSCGDLTVAYRAGR